MTILFDSRFAVKGLGAYESVIHPERATIVDDPINGDIRKVVRLEVHDSDTGPTENPRSQLNGPQLLGEGLEVYIGWSTLIPRDYPELQSGYWVTFQSVYGPPYGGTGPNGVALARQSGDQVVVFGPGCVWPLVKGRWVDHVIRLKMSKDPAVGFAEVYIQGDAQGYRNVPIGGETRGYYSTMKAGVNDAGTNTANLTHYRGAGQWEAATLYHANHRVATTFSEAAPDSYRLEREDLLLPGTPLHKMQSIRVRSGGNSVEIYSLQGQVDGYRFTLWP